MTLSLNHISKAFGDKPVLEDVSLTLAEGERMGILGPSGGGKTTLLNIIAGLTPPDSGERQRPEGRISYVFQEYRLLPWLTAEDNITAVTGCSRAKARTLLEAMELGNELKSYPGALSGGMKQRISIARALAFDADLLLMDEPFKGLDPDLRERVIAQIDAFWGARAILLVTHDPAECELMHCTKIMRM